MSKMFELCISKKQSNVLKGTFAVCVLLHHIYQYTTLFSGTILGIALENLGYLSVSVFLFLSGYGLMVSRQNNESRYMTNFARNKILPFYCQIVITVMLYAAFFLLLKQPIELKEALLSFVFGDGIIINGWYLYCALYLYILFFITFRFFKSPLAQGLCFLVGIVIYYVICLLMGLSHIWYQCIFAFAAGMIYAVISCRVKTLKLWKAGFALIVFGIGFAVSVVAILKTPPFSLGSVVARTISAVTFPLAVVMLKPIIAVVLKPLGVFQRISLEMYVSQGLFLVGVKKLFPLLLKIFQPGWRIVVAYIVLVFVGTILFSILLSKLFTLITRSMKKKEYIG